MGKRSLRALVRHNSINPYTIARWRKRQGRLWPRVLARITNRGIDLAREEAAQRMPRKRMRTNLSCLETAGCAPVTIARQSESRPI